MKFFSFSRLRLRNRRNPNPIPNFPAHPNPERHHAIPGESGTEEPEDDDDDEVVAGGTGSRGDGASREAVHFLDEEDDYRTAATSSSGWRTGDEDDEISSSGERYLTAGSSSSRSSREGRGIFVNDGNSMNATASTTSSVAPTSLAVSEGKRNTDSPPTDDCCPICFGAFVVPCRASCGHWYCGGCILQYWDYGAALQPCNCPMCSRKITNLTPEASLVLQQQVEVAEVLKNVQKYNRLFVGGIYGFILKLLELPLYVRRMFQDMMNPDRPGAHLNKLRILAMLMGLLYTVSPFDFLRIGRQNVIDVFDYSAMALSFILYLVGLYLRRRRFQRVREMAAIQL
ncbi:E3 ubiquitin-protein ligase RNF170-like [Coffea eugenioides]|uniref:E3 ubiquitin-protein ligase RNF170-like n=1 Tax=Coffea eugenioides TaxID=49369 RepID=UPI000F613EC0|nr:E3 ubiquitin-protein ligase RNF170-like [Coffea eugenioides]